MTGKSFPHRGDVFLTRLDPTVGTEINKTRPCLIVSNNTQNQYNDIVCVAPITSQPSTKDYDFEVKTTFEGKQARILLHQTRAIDKDRLIKKIGSLDSKIMKASGAALKVVFAL